MRLSIAISAGRKHQKIQQEQQQQYEQQHEREQQQHRRELLQLQHQQQRRRRQRHQQHQVDGHYRNESPPEYPRNEIPFEYPRSRSSDPASGFRDEQQQSRVVYENGGDRERNHISDVGDGELSGPGSLEGERQHHSQHVRYPSSGSVDGPFEGSPPSYSRTASKPAVVPPPGILRHGDQGREFNGRPPASTAMQAKDLPMRTADINWHNVQVTKVYTADQFEHPAKMARLPLSHWEKSNVAMSVRFKTSIEPQHRPRHYQDGAAHARKASAVNWMPRTRHNSADDSYDRPGYKVSTNNRSTSSSPGSYGNQQVGHNVRSVTWSRGPPASRQRQEFLNNMNEQQSAVSVHEQYRLAARNVVDSILLAESGASVTAEQQSQRDLAFRLLDEAFPLAKQSQGAGAPGRGQRQARSLSAHSYSSRNDILLRGGKDIRRYDDRDSEAALPASDVRGRQAWQKTDPGPSALWQQSLSAGEHEMLIEALRAELGLLNNGVGNR